MTIYRNGVAIELTDHELWSAFMERRAKYNMEDVLDYTINYYSPEDFKDVFGVTVEEFEGMVDDVVDEYADREFDCQEAVYNAVKAVLFKRRPAF